MKLSKFSQVAGAGIVAFGLANVISILPVSAQTGTGTTGTTTDGTTTGTGTTTTDYRDNNYRDNGFDWGWLGLIGLAGLAGLGGKNRPENVNTTYRDPNVR